MPACTESNPLLRGMSPFGRKPIFARFETGHLCSDGGLLARRKVENRPGIAQRLPPAIFCESTCIFLASGKAGGD